MQTSYGGFQKAASIGGEPVQHAVFVTAVAHILTEGSTQYKREPLGPRNEKKGRDLSHLSDLETYYQKQVRDAVSEVSERAREFSRICRDMRRMMSGLEMTRIMCKIERSKADGDTEGLDEIVNRLMFSEKDLNTVMNKIDDAMRIVNDSSERLMRNDKMRAA